MYFDVKVFSALFILPKAVLLAQFSFLNAILTIYECQIDYSLL